MSVYNYDHEQYQPYYVNSNNTYCECDNCCKHSTHRFVKHHGQYYYQDIPYDTRQFHKTAHKVVFAEKDLRCKEYHPTHTHSAPLSAINFPEGGYCSTGADNYITEIALRRTHYDLTNTLPLERSVVSEVIKKVIRLCPSAFNIQSSRVVILYGNSHQRLWDIVKASLLRVTTEAQYKESEQKVNGCFASGAGTILFYEDMDAIRQQQEQYPTYATHFPVWSQHSSAIAQFAVWTALAQLQIGASLQHYNDLIVDDVRKAYDIPISWKLIAQMPFGQYEKNAPIKTFIPDDRRFIIPEE